MSEGWDFITQGVKAIKKATTASGSNKKNDTREGEDDNNDKNKKNTFDSDESQSSTLIKNGPENPHRPQQQKGIGFASDIGLVRSTDEDSIVIMNLMTAFEGKKRRKVNFDPWPMEWGDTIKARWPARLALREWLLNFNNFSQMQT